MIRRTALLAVIAAASLTAPVQAQQVDFNGELRPRMHRYDDATFTEMRARIGLDAAIAKHIKVGTEFQTTYGFGDAAAAGMDLYQAFVQIGTDEGSSLVIGRQEIALGNERLIGAQDFYNGQAFDGAVLTVREGGFALQALALQLSESFDEDGDERLYGVRAATDLLGGELAATGLMTGVTGHDMNVYTYGASYTADRGSWAYSLEAYGQRDLNEENAWMIGARVARDLTDAVRVRAGYDRLGERFATPYGSAHPFYGDADLVFDPADGLQDIMVGVEVAVPTTMSTVAVDFHRFDATADLTEKRLGNELDVRLSRAIWEGVSLDLGVQYVMPEVADNFTQGYLTLKAAF